SLSSFSLFRSYRVFNVVGCRSLCFSSSRRLQNIVLALCDRLIFNRVFKVSVRVYQSIGASNPYTSGELSSIRGITRWASCKNTPADKKRSSLSVRQNTSKFQSKMLPFAGGL